MPSDTTGEVRLSGASGMWRVTLLRMHEEAARLRLADLTGNHGKDLVLSVQPFELETA